MPGRKPIFASLVSNFYYWIRDTAFKVLEPSSGASGKKGKSSGIQEDEKKPW